MTNNNKNSDETYLDLNSATIEPSSIYQGIVNPESLKTTDDYVSLDAATTNKSPSNYQEITKPEALNTTDNYLSLDDTSRKQEAVYQDLDTKKETNSITDVTDGDDSADYETVKDQSDIGQSGENENASRVPIPPKVQNKVDMSGSLYKNWKRK